MIDVIVFSHLLAQYLFLNHWVRLPSAVQPPESPAFSADDSMSWSTSRGKRLFDVVLAVPALVLSLPILFVAATFIRCSSRGPILFRQQRAGLRQRPFTIFKLRTMVDGSEHCGPSVTCKGDPRLTSVGRVLRKLKIDELPQLYNVIRGDMSMVGPRPKLPQHEQMQLFCRPGITGAATLVFAREEEMLLEIPETELEGYVIGNLNRRKAELDTTYARTATVRSDLIILMRTILGAGAI